MTFHGMGGHLGVGAADIDPERAKALKLTDEHGVEVKSVEENSPAAKAGIKAGDVVLEYNGQRVEGMQQFMRMVAETPAGHKATLLVSQNGVTQTLKVTLEPRTGHDAFNWNLDMNMNMPLMPPIPPINIRIPDMPRGLLSWQSSTLGVETESLNPQLAEFFGVKEGVLVRSVLKNSAGEKAGLKAGDVIVKVDGNTVTSPREISSLLRSSSTRKSMPLAVVRNRKEINVDVKLDNVSQERAGANREVL
ncbi:MAG: PDZ domain-containing protein [Bryobacteraceae bacterium]